MHFVGDSLLDLYGELLEHILDTGVEAAPRGQAVLEATLPTMWTLHDPQNWLVPIPGRKFNLFFALAEVIWMWSGKGGVEFITLYNQNLAQFQDPGVPYFHGSYGRRVRHAGYNEQPFRELPSPRTHTQNPVDVEVDQLMHVIAKLERDPFTRQAVVSLWDPVKDNFVRSKDHPCNNMLYFLQRGDVGRQHLSITIVRRSNDLIWGVPYNMCQFAHLQALMAGELGVALGDYTVMANNLHFYRDLYPDQLQVVKDWYYSQSAPEAECYPVTNAKDMRWGLQQFTHFVNTNWDPVERKLRDLADSADPGPGMAAEHVRLSLVLEQQEVPSYWRDVFTVLVMFHLKRVKAHSYYMTLWDSLPAYFQQSLPVF